MADLTETLMKVRKAPGMWGLCGSGQTTRYRALVGFVQGLDLGLSRELLPDFQRWFRERHNLVGSSNLAWFGEISAYYISGFSQRRIDYWELSDEENDLLVNAAFDELILYTSRETT